MYRIRQQAEDLLICDIEYALSKTIEDRLWTRVHYRVIEDFRKRMANVLCSMISLMCSMKNSMETQNRSRSAN